MFTVGNTFLAYGCGVLLTRKEEREENVAKAKAEGKKPPNFSGIADQMWGWARVKVEPDAPAPRTPKELLADLASPEAAVRGAAAEELEKARPAEALAPLADALHVVIGGDAPGKLLGVFRAQDRAFDAVQYAMHANDRGRTDTDVQVGSVFRNHQLQQVRH
jgi:hypothetical protein